MSNVCQMALILTVVLLIIVALHSRASGESVAGLDNDGVEKGQNTGPIVIDEYVVDTLIDSAKWADRMTLPSAVDVECYQTDQRSPYVVCEPLFIGIEGYTEYAVDFRSDALPTGTYLCVCNLNLDAASLKAKYADVSRDYDGVAAYAGFQVWEDGTTVAIMSVWDTYVRDSSGITSTLHAKKVFPKDPEVYQPFGGEGTGMKCMVKYDWLPGKTYRALIQCGTTQEGMSTLDFYVCDLESGTWTRLISYDLGYSHAFINWGVAFLENYLTDTAGCIRTMELSNFRVRPIASDEWVSATKGTFSQSYVNPSGSYNYGTSGNCFWVITSGIPGLASSPAGNKTYVVSDAQIGAPY